MVVGWADFFPFFFFLVEVVVKVAFPQQNPAKVVVVSLVVVVVVTIVVGVVVVVGIVEIVGIVVAFVVVGKPENVDIVVGKVVFVG